MDLLFSFQGRIGRGKWWLAQLACVACLLSAGALAGVSLLMLAFGVIPPLTSSLVAAYCILALSTWINLASTIKRYHDRGRSGWWSLLLLIPYLGSIIVLIECGFFRAKDQGNPYGHNGGNPDLDALWDSVKKPAAREPDVATRRVQSNQPHLASQQGRQNAGFGRGFN